MDTKKLTDENIELGKSALLALDKAELRITSALWFYFKNTGWKYLLATPDINIKEPTKTLDKFNKILKESELPKDFIINYGIMPADAPLLILLKSAINTGDKSIASIRFTRNVINGQFIDDAYLYRIS